mgnify:CR=1 FL=1
MKPLDSSVVAAHGPGRTIWATQFDSGICMLAGVVTQRIWSHYASVGPYMRTFGVREDQALPEVEDCVMTLFDDNSGAVDRT